MFGDFRFEVIKVIECGLLLVRVCVILIKDIFMLLFI